jgi:diguanylate cyclase (GGDEF)-like protein
VGPLPATSVPSRRRLLWAAVALIVVAVIGFLTTQIALNSTRVGAAAMPALGLPSPSALPSVPPTILPTSLPSILPSPSKPPVAPPSLPPLKTPAPPSPSLPPVPSPPIPPIGGTPGGLGSPSPAPSHGGLGPGNSGSGGSNGDPRGANGGSTDPSAGGGGGISIPLTTIVLHSPFDIALAGALATLPLLVGMWLLLFGRTWTTALQARNARVRLAVAADLGISPRELVSLGPEALFKIREEAAFDDLTGTLRRAAGVHALEREIARARRQKSPMSIAFLDLDGLKQANDTRGHRAGDELLRNLALTLKEDLRGQDLVMRYGGDEFVCVLPDTVGDAARAKLSWVQTDAAKRGINFSIGLAQLERSDDVVSLLARADQELYQAKARRGRVGAPTTVVNDDVRQSAWRSARSG